MTLKRRTRAAICSITRKRHKMFGAMVKSLADLQIPKNVDPFIVLVENNEQREVESIIDRNRAKFGSVRVIYELETAIGIPFARNKAVDLALAEKADIILFIDDDEIVPSSWLEQMTSGFVNSERVLIGGPVMPRFESSPSGLWETVLRRGIISRYKRVARKANRRHADGMEGKVAIITNNWLADAKLFTTHGLKFDTTLQYSGGSDTKFWRDVKAKGLPTGWQPDAVLFETIPPSRITLSYQFRRGMENSRASLDSKLKSDRRALTVLTVIGVITLRSIGLLLSIFILPLSGGSSIVQTARNAGWLFGRISGLLGVQSNLYRITDGE